MKALTSTICILLLLNSLNFAQDSIGFSFNSDRDDTPMDENTIAGVVPSSGWVSTDGTGAGANGTLDNNGVTIDWSSNGTWNTNNGVTNGDNHLMNSYIDAVGDGGYSDIDVSGIDTFTFGAAYDLYVYFGSDGNGRTGKVALQDGETYSYSTFSQQGGGFPGSYIRTEDVGDGNPNANYAIFEGLSGDTQTLQIIRGSNNSGFHGIQIVSLQVFDEDEDGLPDNWEINNDLDSEDNGDEDPNNGAEGDPDQDGLTNIDEFENGTDPQDADTDDDGDGYTEQDGDCHDDNADIHPAQEEVPENGIDDNCDGATDETGALNPNTYYFDSDGDGEADSPDQTLGQYVAWAPFFTVALRETLGPEAVILSNSAGPLSDPMLNGITVEAESCRDSKVCYSALRAQRDVSFDPFKSESVLWLTHSELVPPEKQCALVADIQQQMPWVLAGTDFFEMTDATMVASFTVGRSSHRGIRIPL